MKVFSHLNKYVVILTCHLCLSNEAYSHHTVRTSSELKALLAEDKDQGTIRLAGDVFELDNAQVKAGGIIKPACGRKPILTGKLFAAKRENGVTAENGYWKIKIPIFTKKDFYVFDKDMKPLEITNFMFLNPGGEPIIDKEIIKIDKGQIVKIRIPEDCAFVRNKSKKQLANCILKFGVWFRSQGLTDLYSDSEYIYGHLESKNLYNNIHHYSYLPVTVHLFNYPSKDNSKTGSIYVDADNYAHIPNDQSVVYFSLSSQILKLVGNNSLTFKNVVFMGSDRAVEMTGASNKTFANCTFATCGSGIWCNNGANNVECNTIVKNCTFKDLYSGPGVRLHGADNIIVKGNTLTHIGYLNKGWYGTIEATGNNFLVEDNTVTDFSYIGIRSGNSETTNREVIVGAIRNNLVDNIANFGHAERQACDGGGIYFYARSTDVTISDNIVRNIGFKSSLQRGIFLDGGAHNLTVDNNLVYNVFAPEYAFFSPYVKQVEYSSKNIRVRGNVFLGNCLFSANPEGAISSAKDNYIEGNVTFQGDKTRLGYENNASVKSIVGHNGKVSIDCETKVNTRVLSRAIRKVLNSRIKIEE